jgi:hypothetical protein
MWLLKCLDFLNRKNRKYLLVDKDSGEEVCGNFHEARQGEIQIDIAS